MPQPYICVFALLGLLVFVQCSGPGPGADGRAAAAASDIDVPAAPDALLPGEFLGTWNTTNGETSDLRLLEKNIDGIPYALIEGDIILDLKARVETPQPGDKPLFEAGTVKPWSHAVVPYDYSNGFSSKALVESAIREFSGTPVRFVQRTTAHNGPFIRFYDTSDPNVGGIAMLGCNPRVHQHKVWINKDPRKVTRGIVVHELMHSLGFGHEQCRSDARRYVTIHKENILKKFRNQFDHVPLSKDVGPYDYHSITHYPRSAFAKRQGLDTIVPVKNPPGGIRRVHAYEIGVANKLSAGDRAALKAVYGPEAKKRQ